MSEVATRLEEERGAVLPVLGRGHQRHHHLVVGVRD